MATKKPFKELTPAGQKKRLNAIRKEQAEKNLRPELLQVVTFKHRGQVLPPKVTEVPDENGNLLGHNITFRVRRCDYSYVLIDGVKTMVPYKEIPEGAQTLPFKEAKVYGNAYAFAKVGTNLKDFYASVKPGVYYNALVRTDRVPVNGKGDEQLQDVFLYNMFFAKGLNKTNPYAQKEDAPVDDVVEDLVEEAPMDDANLASLILTDEDLPF